MLSDWFEGIKGTAGDTEVYIFQGAEPGGKALVLGGTHGNEIGSYMAGIVLVENAMVTKGTLYVIPRANRGGLTCTDPGDAAPGAKPSVFSVDQHVSPASPLSLPTHRQPGPTSLKITASG